MINNQELSWHSLLKIYKYFISDVSQAINSPQSNPVTTVLVVGILLLVAAIAGLLLWLVAASILGRKGPAADVLIAKHYEVTRREVWVNRIVFLFAILIVVNGVYYFGSQSSVCRRCHSGDLILSVGKSTHAKVSCVSCHSDPGIDGYVVQFFDYARWIGRFTLSEDERRYDVRVPNGACLRCHEKVAREVVERWGVRARHSDFLEAGARCVECHNAVAHGKSLAVVKEPAMDKCLMCHNNKRASADCKLCHTSNASASTRKLPEEIIRVETEPMRNCRGCHPQTAESPCIRCHGLEMPHPEDWAMRRADGGPNAHARAGFLNKKLCKKCHEFPDGLKPVFHSSDPVYPGEIFCNRCHNYPSVHGPTERWVKMHGLAALKQQYSLNNLCGQCHPAENEQRCSYCHSRELCDSCHNNGLSEKPID